MKTGPFFTILPIAATGCCIRYVEPPDWSVKAFSGIYANPGVATREFKKLERHQSSEYVGEDVFYRRIAEYHAQHDRDVAKLEKWQNSSKR